MDDRSIDFRLLECLQTLVAERHVTKAAERLGMSQPKLSNALARLRSITGDPLLVRTREGMMPTEVALRLAGYSAEFLQRWTTLVGRNPNFSPESTERTFRIEVVDFLVQDLLVDLVAELRTVAPNISLSLSGPVQTTVRERLETGELDLVIGGVSPMPQDLYVSQLTSYLQCCIVAADHPRIRDELTLEDYMRETHVVPSFGRSHQPSNIEQYVDSLLAEQHVHRRAAVYVPSVLVVPDLVARTDLLAITPQPLGERSAKRLPLKVFAPPFPLPRNDISMVWHARTKNDPGNRWLRAMLRRFGQNATASQALE